MYQQEEGNPNIVFTLKTKHFPLVLCPYEISALKNNQIKKIQRLICLKLCLLGYNDTISITSKLSTFKTA